MLAVHTILHPTDFSEHSKYAFWLACALARDYGARLVIVHVVAAPAIVYGEGVVPPNAEGPGMVPSIPTTCCEPCESATSAFTRKKFS